MQLTPDFIAYLAGLWIGFWFGVIAMIGFQHLWKTIQKRARQEDLEWLLQDIEELGYTRDEAKALLNRIQAMGELDELKRLRRG